MKSQDRLAGMLGMAAKAGKLVYGLQSHRGKGERRRPPYLVLIAADASENTKKRIRNCCIYYERTYRLLPPSMGQAALSHATGRAGLISCVGVSDEGFSEALRKLTDRREAPAEDTAGGRGI